MKRKTIKLMLFAVIIVLATLFIMPATAYADPIEGDVWVIPYGPYDDGGTPKWDVDINAFANYANGLNYDLILVDSGGLVDGTGGSINDVYWSMIISVGGIGEEDYKAIFDIANNGSSFYDTFDFNLWVHDQGIDFDIDGHDADIEWYATDSEGRNAECVLFRISDGTLIDQFYPTIDDNDWMTSEDYNLSNGDYVVVLNIDGYITLRDFSISGEGKEVVWVRTQEMTCKQVWINEDNMFQFSFIYPYRDNNWVRIYDMTGNMVYEIDMPLDNPNIIVDLPGGTYTVKTFHDQLAPIQEFVIGKP